MNDFDPLAYIENAFLDKRKEKVLPETDDLTVTIPSFSDYLSQRSNGSSTEQRDGSAGTATIERPKEAMIAEQLGDTPVAEKRPRAGEEMPHKNPALLGPRPKRTRVSAKQVQFDDDMQAVWEILPKSLEVLSNFYDDAVTANYYQDFKESRADLIRRLVDPQLTMEETSRLLGVCPATIRRYTGRGWLQHHRTDGGQRRFRLSDIVRFVKDHGILPGD